jgi:hypothetical protein
LAVIECEPEGNEDVANAAMPSLRDDVPKIVEPSLKVTVPVGVPEPWRVTEAERVTDCPKTEGFDEEATAVVVVLRELTSRVVGKPRV